MPIPLTTLNGHHVWDILVEECGAEVPSRSTGDHLSGWEEGHFLTWWEGDHHPNPEYRFEGNLGISGKIYRECSLGRSQSLRERAGRRLFRGRVSRANIANSMPSLLRRVTCASWEADRLWVGCDDAQRSPERAAQVERANARLAELSKKPWNVESGGIGH